LKFIECSNSILFRILQTQHADVFPNKSCLQLKIREVRQKLMSTNQGQGNHLGPTTPSPLTPSGGGGGESASTFDLPLTPATPNDPSDSIHSHGGPTCSAAATSAAASSSGSSQLQQESL